MEMGMGLALAKQFGGIDNILSNNMTMSNESIAEKLRQLKLLYDENLLTEDEYKVKKSELINKL